MPRRPRASDPRTAVMLLMALLGLGSLSAPRFATAATYYVATNGGGSTCSFDNPCNNVLTGISKLGGAGDTLFIRGGTYENGTILGGTVPGGSSWNNAVPGGSVVWIGAYKNGDTYENVTIQGNGHDGTLEMWGSNYVVWDHLHFHSTYSGSTTVQAGSGRQRYQHGQITMGTDPPCVGGTLTNAITVIIFSRPGDSPQPGGAEFIDNDVPDNRCNYSFYVQHYTEGFLLDGNRIHGNFGYGFHTFVPSEDCPKWSTIPCFHNIIFRNNDVYNNGNPFHQCGAIVYECDNCLFYNNVFYDNWCGFQLRDYSQNTKIFNNTFYNTPSDYALPIFQFDDSNGNGIELKNNISYLGGCGLVGGNGSCGAAMNPIDNTNNTYSQGDVPGNEFVDVGGKNFRLQSGSSNINNGVNLSNYFTTDKDGNARPATGNWSRGAYQFGSGGTPPLPVPTNLRVLSLTP